MTTTLLERVAAADGAKRAAGNRQYLALVRKAAEGAELDPDAVLADLAALGRDVTEYAADVERMARRIDLAAALAAVPGYERERAETLDKIAKADAVLARAEEKHATDTAPLKHRLSRLTDLIGNAHGVRQELAAGCLDPDAVAAAEAARAAVAAAAARHAAALRAVEEKRETVDVHTNRVEKGGQFVDAYRADLDRSTAELAALKAAAAEAEAAVRQAEAARDAAEEALVRA
jgi:chromosome segregation ATPase